MRPLTTTHKSLHRTLLFQLSVRRLMVLVAVCSLLFAYAGSYYRLSRRGILEAPDYGIPGFVYIPVAEAVASKDLRRHYTLAIVYAPLNWIDRTFFGGPSPCYCWMRLSG